MRGVGRWPWLVSLLVSSACGAKSEPTSATSTSKGSSATSARSEGPPPGAMDGAAPLEVRLLEDGVSFVVGGAAVGAGCKGTTGVTVPRDRGAVQDFAAVSVCARALRSDARLEDVATARLSAYPAASYQELVNGIDAVAGARGELFPAIEFGFPVGWPASARGWTGPGRMASRSPSASLPDEGPVVRLSKTQLMVGDEVVVRDLGDRESLVANGFSIQYKRGKSDDPFIAPLAAELEPYRTQQLRTAEAKGLRAPSGDAVLVVDAETPYRLLFELLFTLEQAGLGTYHLVALTGGR